MTKSEKAQSQISYMLNDSNLNIKVSSFSGSIFLRSESEHSFKSGLVKLVEKMKLKVVYQYCDDGEFEAMLEV